MHVAAWWTLITLLTAPDRCEHSRSMADCERCGAAGRFEGAGCSIHFPGAGRQIQLVGEALHALLPNLHTQTAGYHLICSV